MDDVAAYHHLQPNFNGMNPSLGMSDYIEIQSIYEPNPVPINVSSFDSQQELLWTGNTEGRVASYYGLGLSKYTSFKVTHDMEIRNMYPHRPDHDAIYLLNADMISAYTRFGVNLFKHKETSFQNMQCMYFNQQERFYLGGFTDNIFDFDIERLRILRQISIDEKDCILMKYSTSRSLLVTGTTNGQINIRDPFSLKSQHTFHPHSGSLSDFDVHGNYLATCGFSTRLGSLCVDRFLMVYDLRTMRVLNPIQLLIEPSFVHYIPMCSSVVAIASQSGCFQLCDTQVTSSSAYCQLYQAQVSPMGICTTFSVSDTCQAIVFGHSTGSLHLFAKSENASFNDYSLPTIFADPVPELGYMDINQEMPPLSSIPVPLTDEMPISEWPKEWCTYEYRPTPKIDDELTSNARVIHGIMSVPNRTAMKRNQDFQELYKAQLANLGEMAAGTFEDLTNLPVESEKKEQEESPELVETPDVSNSPNLDAEKNEGEQDEPKQEASGEN